MTNGIESHPHVLDAGRDEEFPSSPEVIDPTKDDIQQRIVYFLGIYPRMSPSMLQVALGTSLPPVLWKPILDAMIRNGEVRKAQISATTPKGRFQTYKVLTLPDGAPAPSISIE